MSVEGRHAVASRCRKSALPHYAADSRNAAQEAIDPERKAELLEMEQRWLRLAESYRLVEQLDRFVTEINRHRQKWSPE
jgi:hypothetical protein